MLEKEKTAIWDLEIGELAGHNIEAKGREEVNQKLRNGWVLLHIYTLTYKEDEEWRERPMAILGKPKKQVKKLSSKSERFVAL